MCTAITYKTKNHYFGRTLDLEYTYEERVTVTPRNYEFRYRTKESVKNHYAIIGMATVVENYPLYYEATNEWGLSMAGLNFPGNAHYFPVTEGKDNISPFEFIPWILSQCKNLAEARKLLKRINLCNLDFSEKFPLSSLHWIVADREGAVTVESVSEGLKVYENPIGVLTNNPAFDYHMTHLCDFINLTKKTPENHFGDVSLPLYSRGMGAMGLPGDLSSASRFVRAAFVKLNSVSGEGEMESISQFFHILGAVAQQRGCVQLPDGSYEITAYTSCMNTDKGIYYYTTYDNHAICGVDMHRCDLDGETLYTYPLSKEQQIMWQNE
ncbi:MAG: choloylglycine hydrolase [Lachnospiraceae bacterium]|nr:choloylglycine hydrolase [Lachnospiraceae bacterium]